MKRIIAACAAVVLAASLAAAGATTYGKPLTVKETTKVSDILAKPEQFDGKRVKIEGPVVDVCQMRGCWI